MADRPTALGGVIRVLTEAREAAIDADEDLARRHPEARFAGVTFSVSSLDELIVVLQAVERLHGTNARRLRLLQWATLTCSVVALLLALWRL